MSGSEVYRRSMGTWLLCKAEVAILETSSSSTPDNPPVRALAGTERMEAIFRDLHTARCRARARLVLTGMK